MTHEVLKLAKLHGGPEVFFSIQGEGPSVGRPSVFVRCSLCNLYCIWCDSDYTWNWLGTPFPHERDSQSGYQKYEKAQQLVELSLGELHDAILQYSGRNVVLTGGEPLIQQRGLAKLMEKLRCTDASYRFEVETNGTILPIDEFHSCIDQYNVSVKLNNSRVTIETREKSKVIEFFASQRACFKFVIDTERDLTELEELVKRYSIAPDLVFLMPQGRSSMQLRDKSVWLIEHCKKHGYRFSDRLHVHLYGDTRGT